MTNFHGKKQEQEFFEGWYLKHQSEKHTIAIIPAYHVSNRGDATASIQIITDKASFTVSFLEKDFMACKHSFDVKIGENVFTSNGMELHIETPQITILGEIKYAPFTPLHYTIMGPFKFAPHMQCNHGVLSLGHALQGNLTINGEVIDFSGGIGYAEKDWGTSFPKKYFWTQCNWQNGQDNCVMASVAHIPFLKSSFMGCICVVYYGGKQYRLATYKGVKILSCTRELIALKQGKYRLEIYPLHHNAHALQGPCKGDMCRTIHESPSTQVRYKFCVNDVELFDVTQGNASCEVMLE